MRKTNLVLALLLAIGVSGCLQDHLTAFETRVALEETASASQALNSAAGVIEITTNFTIGQGVEAAAAELKAFIESQLPCAQVTIEGAKLTVEYGALAGNCTYHGQTYSGSHSVTIESAAAGELSVHHEWDALSNQKISVTGIADVTWSTAESSRHVVHELSWTTAPYGENFTGTGDRTQTALPAGIVEGIQIEGTRGWTSERGQWDLFIDGVEARWVDPVPQSGSYELVTPFGGKSAKMTFARVDEDTIAVTVTTGGIGFRFDVTKAGNIIDN